MRVRVRGYTNKSPFLTIEVLKPLLKKGKVIYMPKANSEAHTKWLCKYHIVFTPKYRRKKFTINIRRTWRRYCTIYVHTKGWKS